MPSSSAGASNSSPPAARTRRRRCHSRADGGRRRGARYADEVLSAFFMRLILLLAAGFAAYFIWDWSKRDYPFNNGDRVRVVFPGDEDSSIPGVWRGEGSGVIKIELPSTTVQHISKSKIKMIHLIQAVPNRFWRWILWGFITVSSFAAACWYWWDWDRKKQIAKEQCAAEWEKKWKSMTEEERRRCL